MSNNKKQHYVPKFYLKAWCDSGTPQSAYIWMASKDGTSIERKSPSNIFHETDLYAIDIMAHPDEKKEQKKKDKEEK